MMLALEILRAVKRNPQAEPIRLVGPPRMPSVDSQFCKRHPSRKREPGRSCCAGCLVYGKQREEMKRLKRRA